MSTQFLDMPIHVLTGWKLGDDPSATEAMLMLSEGGGHHTEIFDMQDIDTWLTEHHPEVYTNRANGKKTLDLTTVPPAVLAPCLEYARRKRHETKAPQLAGYEVGELVDVAALYAYGK